MNAKHIILLASLSAGAAGCIAYAQPYYPPQPPPDQGAYGDPGAYQAPDGQDYYGDQAYYNQDDQGYQDQGYDQGYTNGQPVSVEFFYRQLAPYGHWVERSRYGWVWYPGHVRAGWRPYTDGRWVMTDYGWTWVAQEPYGWATYHYGRWAFDDEYGWVWVPGTQWGPAWVAWQQGAGYIGWAPLPPSVQFRAGIGLDFGGINLSVSLGPSAYCFVPERQFLAPSVAAYVAPEARNVTIIRNTTNITSYRVVNNRIVNQSVPVQRIEQVTGRRVQRLRVADAPNPAQGRIPRIQGDQVTIFRPRVNTTRPVETPQQAIQQRPVRAPRAARAPQPGTIPVPGTAQPGYVPQPGASRPANVAPAPRMRRPITTDEVQRRQEVEHQQLTRQQADEQRRLSEIQRQDQQSRPQGASAQQIEQQHQAEARALQQQQQRDKQQLEARHQREQQLAAQAQQSRRPQPQQDQGKKNDNGNRGNDNNRGNGRNRDRQQQQPPPPPPSR